MVELLLEEGVDKDTKNRWGKTPLDEAIASRCAGAEGELGGGGGGD